MFRRKTSVVLILAAIGGAIVLSHPAPGNGQAPDFSSVYTDLSKDCKAAVKRVAEGQDVPLRCKGYGGYEIIIDYSAMSAHLRIQSTHGEQAASVAPQPLSYYDKKKLEWRLAKGKPFAIIVRGDRYKDESGNIDADTYSPQNVTGTYLFVVGLKGHEYINGKIDVKTPNANAMAREMADAGFKRGQ
jgi:hypothetical protein